MKNFLFEKRGTKNYFKIILIIVLQLFLFTNIDLSYAFSIKDVKVVSEGGQNLAVSTSNPAVSFKMKEWANKGGFNKEVLNKGIKNVETSSKTKLSNQDKIIDKYLTSTAASSDKKGFIIDNKDLIKKYAKDNGIALRSLLTLLSLNDDDGSNFEKDFIYAKDKKLDREEKDKNKFEKIAEYIKKKEKTYEENDPAELDKTHKGEWKRVVFDAYKHNFIHKDGFLPDDIKGIDDMYKTSLDTAQALLNGKNISFNGSTIAERSGILSKGADVLEDIVYELGEFEFRDAMGLTKKDIKGEKKLSKEQKDKLKDKMTALINLFRESDKKGTSQSKLFKILKNYEEHLNLEHRERDILGKTNHAGTTLKEMWEKYYGTKNDSNFDEAIKENEKLVDITIGHFKMAKRYIALLSTQHILHFGYSKKAEKYKVGISMPFVSGLINKAVWFGSAIAGIGGIFVGIFLGFTLACQFVFIPILCAISIWYGLRFASQIYRTDNKYSSIGIKILSAVLTIGVLAGAFAFGYFVLPLITGTATFAWALMFGIGVAAIAFWLWNFILRFWTVDLNDFSERKIYENMKDVEKSINKKDGIKNVDRGSKKGMYLADLVQSMNFLKTARNDFEPRRSQLLLDNPKALTIKTINDMFLRVKRDCYNLTYSLGDNFAVYDKNIEKFRKKVVHENEKALKLYKGQTSLDDQLRLKQYKTIITMAQERSIKHQILEARLTGDKDKSTARSLQKQLDRLEEINILLKTDSKSNKFDLTPGQRSQILNEAEQLKEAVKNIYGRLLISSDNWEELLIKRDITDSFINLAGRNKKDTRRKQSFLDALLIGKKLTVSENNKAKLKLDFGEKELPGYLRQVLGGSKEEYEIEFDLDKTQWDEFKKLYEKVNLNKENTILEQNKKLSEEDNKKYRKSRLQLINKLKKQLVESTDQYSHMLGYSDIEGDKRHTFGMLREFKYLSFVNKYVGNTDAVDKLTIDKAKEILGKIKADENNKNDKHAELYHKQALDRLKSDLKGDLDEFKKNVHRILNPKFEKYKNETYGKINLGKKLKAFQKAFEAKDKKNSLEKGIDDFYNEFKSWRIKEYAKRKAIYMTLFSLYNNFEKKNSEIAVINNQLGNYAVQIRKYSGQDTKLGHLTGKALEEVNKEAKKDKDGKEYKVEIKVDIKDKKDDDGNITGYEVENLDKVIALQTKYWNNIFENFEKGKQEEKKKIEKNIPEDKKPLLDKKPKKDTKTNNQLVFKKSRKKEMKDLLGWKFDFSTNIVYEFEKDELDKSKLSKWIETLKENPLRGLMQAVSPVIKIAIGGAIGAFVVYIGVNLISLISASVLSVTSSLIGIFTTAAATGLVFSGGWTIAFIIIGSVIAVAAIAATAFFIIKAVQRQGKGRITKKYLYEYIGSSFVVAALFLGLAGLICGLPFYFIPFISAMTAMAPFTVLGAVMVGVAFVSFVSAKFLISRGYSKLAFALLAITGISIIATVNPLFMALAIVLILSLQFGITGINKLVKEGRFISGIAFLTIGISMMAVTAFFIAPYLAPLFLMIVEFSLYGILATYLLFTLITKYKRFIVKYIPGLDSLPAISVAEIKKGINVFAKIPVIGNVLVAALNGIVEEVTLPFNSLINSNDSIKQDVDEIKEILEAYNYDFQPGSIIEPAKIATALGGKQRFINLVYNLNNKLRSRKENPDTLLEELYKETDIETDQENSIKKSILKFALLSEKTSTDKLIDRIKRAETKTLTPTLYATTEFKGRADMMKKADLNLSIWQKIRINIEDNFQRYYLRMIFGIPTVITLIYFSMLIFIGTQAVFPPLLLFGFGVISSGLLWILMTSNAQVFTDKIASFIIKPVMMPEVEQPYNSEEHGHIVYPPMPGGGDRNVKKYPLGMEMEKNRDNVGFYTIDDNMRAMQSSLKNNPYSSVLAIGDAREKPMLFNEFYRKFKISEVFGPSRFWRISKDDNEGWKWGKKILWVQYAMGQDYKRQLYDMALDGRETLWYSFDSNDPRHNFNTMWGGGNFDWTNQGDILKGHKLIEFRKNVNEAMRLREKHGEFSKKFKDASDTVTGAYCSFNKFKVSQLYKNDGVAMFLSPEAVMKKNKSGDGGIGSTIEFNQDSDNDVYWKGYNRTGGFMQSRINRHIGIFQPVTEINNSDDTLYASQSGIAHRSLGFHSKVLNSTGYFSYYGKGIWDMSSYYLNISLGEVISRDTLSHDTVEAIGGLIYYLLHGSGYSRLVYDLVLGEGSATTFPAAAIRGFIRWLFGTWQSIRELFEHGSVGQKFITMLPIKGYISEPLFLIYILLGFFAVLFNALYFASPIINPVIIMIGIYIFSMIMMIVIPKFTDLNLARGGEKRNFFDSLKELLISTTIYLNNPVAGTEGIVGVLKKNLQEKSSGASLSLAWTPSAVLETVYGDPTLKQSYEQFASQRRLGLLLIVILIFTLLFFPALGLVWSNALMYFFWSFPLIWSLCIGWYFAKKSGESRTRLALARDRIEEGISFKGYKGKPSIYNKIVGSEKSRIWDIGKMDQEWGLIGGIRNRIGIHIRDLQTYLKAKTEEEKKRIAKILADREAVNINHKTCSIVKVFGAGMVLLGIIGFFNVLLLTTISAVFTVAPASIFILGFLTILGIVLYLAPTIHSKWFNSFKYEKSEGKKRIVWTRLILSIMMLASITSIIAGISLLIVYSGVLGVAFALLFGETMLIIVGIAGVGCALWGFYTTQAGFNIPFLYKLFKNIPVLNLLFCDEAGSKFNLFKILQQGDETKSETAIQAYKKHLKEAIWQAKAGSITTKDETDALIYSFMDEVKDKDKIYENGRKLSLKEIKEKDAKYYNAKEDQVKEILMQYYLQLFAEEDIEDKALYGIDKDGYSMETKKMKENTFAKEINENSKDIIESFEQFNNLRMYFSQHKDDKDKDEDCLRLLSLDDAKKYMVLNRVRKDREYNVKEILNQDAENIEKEINKAKTGQDLYEKAQIEIYLTYIKTLNKTIKYIDNEKHLENPLIEFLKKRLKKARKVTEVTGRDKDINAINSLIKTKDFWLEYEKLALEYLKPAIDSNESTKRYQGFVGSFQGTLGAVIFREFRENDYHNAMRKYMGICYDYLSKNNITDISDFDKEGNEKHVLALLEGLNSLTTEKWWNIVDRKWNLGKNIKEQLWKLSDYDTKKMIKLFKASGHIQAVVSAVRLSRENDIDDETGNEKSKLFLTEEELKEEKEELEKIEKELKEEKEEKEEVKKIKKEEFKKREEEFKKRKEKIRILKEDFPSLLAAVHFEGEKNKLSKAIKSDTSSNKAAKFLLDDVKVFDKNKENKEYLDYIESISAPNPGGGKWGGWDHWLYTGFTEKVLKSFEDKVKLTDADVKKVQEEVKQKFRKMLFEYEYCIAGLGMFDIRLLCRKISNIRAVFGHEMLGVKIGSKTCLALFDEAMAYSYLRSGAHNLKDIYKHANTQEATSFSWVENWDLSEFTAKLHKWKVPEFIISFLTIIPKLWTPFELPKSFQKAELARAFKKNFNRFFNLQTFVYAGILLFKTALMAGIVALIGFVGITALNALASGFGLAVVTVISGWVPIVIAGLFVVCALVLMMIMDIIDPTGENPFEKSQYMKNGKLIANFVSIGIIGLGIMYLGFAQLSLPIFCLILAGIGAVYFVLKSVLVFVIQNYMEQQFMRGIAKQTGLKEFLEKPVSKKEKEIKKEDKKDAKKEVVNEKKEKKINQQEKSTVNYLFSLPALENSEKLKIFPKKLTEQSEKNLLKYLRKYHSNIEFDDNILGIAQTDWKTGKIKINRKVLGFFDLDKKHEDIKIDKTETTNTLEDVLKTLLIGKEKKQINLFKNTNYKNKYFPEKSTQEIIDILNKGDKESVEKDLEKIGKLESESMLRLITDILFEAGYITEENKVETKNSRLAFLKKCAEMFNKYLDYMVNSGWCKKQDNDPIYKGITVQKKMLEFAITVKGYNIFKGLYDVNQKKSIDSFYDYINKETKSIQAAEIYDPKTAQALIAA